MVYHTQGVCMSWDSDTALVEFLYTRVWSPSKMLVFHNHQSPVWGLIVTMSNNASKKYKNQRIFFSYKGRETRGILKSIFAAIRGGPFGVNEYRESVVLIVGHKVSGTIRYEAYIHTNVFGPHSGTTRKNALDFLVTILPECIRAGRR